MTEGAPNAMSPMDKRDIPGILEIFQFLFLCISIESAVPLTSAVLVPSAGAQEIVPVDARMPVDDRAFTQSCNRGIGSRHGDILRGIDLPSICAAREKLGEYPA